MAIFLYQLLYILSVCPHLALIAVVTIDEHHEMCRLKGYLRALVVRRGRAHSTFAVAVDRKAGNVYHASPDALVWLAFTANAERQGVALKLVGIEASDAVTVGYAREIHQIDKRVYLVKALARELTTDKSLGGRTITRRVLATGTVYPARGGYARQLFQRLRGKRLAETFAQGVYLIPQRLAILAIHHLSLNACANKRRAHRLNLF